MQIRHSIKILFILNILTFQKSIFSQNAILNLQQKTNYFLSRDSYHQTWISSTGGVIVFDGLDTKNYSPATHNMIGANVMSHFFEDDYTNMWFSTYNALHVYVRKKDNFIPFQFKDSNGNLIQKEYKVFYKHDSLLFLKFGSRYGVFNIRSKKLVFSQSLDLSKYSEFDMRLEKNNLYLACLSKLKLDVYKTNLIITDTLQIFKSINVKIKVDQTFGLQWLAHEKILFNTGEKILLYDLTLNQLSDYKRFNAKPIDFNFDEHSEEVIVLYPKSIYCYNAFGIEKWNKQIEHKGNLTPLHVIGNEVWYGEDGFGLFYFNKNKQKFDKYKLLNGKQGANARGLYQDSKKRYWFASRTDGIGQFSSDGKLIHSYTIKNGRSSTDFILNLIEVNDGSIIGTGGKDVVIFNELANRFVKINMNEIKPNHFFGQIIKTRDSKILLIDWYNPSSIFQLIKDGNNYSLEEVKIENNKAYEFYNIFTTNTDTLYFSINSTELGIGLYKNNKIQLIKTFVTNSQLNDFKIVNNLKYFAFTNGIYTLRNNILTKVNHQILNQNIYCILDFDNILYLSTNNGLVSYNCNTNLTHQFSTADGIQDLEYNKTGSLKDANGNLWFGGVNGVNKIDPRKVKFLEDPVPINISSLKIQGVEAKSYNYYNDIKELNLTYMDNTIEFHFNGIDYSDPSSVKLKCKLANYETKWNELENNNGFARYPNLPPGKYKLQILAANSDGIWNKTPKVIDISIRPPFYLTWWFYLITTFTVLSVLYLAVRSYYKRKLEKKNQLLREQALIIQSQAAIQSERNRIASEMHDDLGSGLTTIKYLSDKAIEKVHDENEQEEIRKIASHSNELVRNMSEIIWAMNSRFDTSENLVAYIRRYASEYLEEHNIDLHFLDNTLDQKIGINGEKRRNVFLVIKEILHNAVKYSGASAIEIKIDKEDVLTISIIEIGGRGFDFEAMKDKGNGLYNIEKRLRGIASIKFQKSDLGMLTTISIGV